ncbi:hypothetical protein IW262DRAFT_1454792 [Armillaria fumosa]|nr:hypothetical protein IW262DRAFT_1454792 [Armillaria fumosa]
MALLSSMHLPFLSLYLNNIDVCSGIYLGATIGAILALIQIEYAILGFGAAGPVPGGTATKIQSSMGNVPAGSLFSHLQSVH